MCVKGKEIPAHEPRNKPGLALIYATGPIGPDFGGVEHDPDFDSEVGVPYALDKGGAFDLLEWLPETEMSARKVRQTVVLERWWSGGTGIAPLLPVRHRPSTVHAAGQPEWNMKFKPEPGHGNEVLRYMRHFEECLLEDMRPSVDEIEGAKCIAVCSAAWDSVASGQPAKIFNDF